MTSAYNFGSYGFIVKKYSPLRHRSTSLLRTDSVRGEKASHHEVFCELTLAYRTKRSDHRHAGMDGRHPVRKDAFANIHVNLDSSSSMLE
jgi:hypothetical protein